MLKLGGPVSCSVVIIITYILKYVDRVAQSV